MLLQADTRFATNLPSITSAASAKTRNRRQSTFNVYSAGKSGPVLLCLHGGGYTGLTWSLVAAKLKDKYRIMAPDLRGHGLTVTANDADLSATTMAADVVELWRTLFGGLRCADALFEALKSTFLSCGGSLPVRQR